MAYGSKTSDLESRVKLNNEISREWCVFSYPSCLHEICFTTQTSRRRQTFDAENSATSDYQLGFTQQ